jgi:hypothetical protein
MTETPPPPPEIDESDKRFEFEKFKYKVELLKWFVASVVLVVITTIIDSGLKDRAEGIVEIEQYSKYVNNLIVLNDQIGPRRKLAQFFSKVTASKKLREGWVDYFKAIDTEYNELNQEYADTQKKYDSLYRKPNRSVEDSIILSHLQDLIVYYNKQLNSPIKIPANFISPGSKSNYTPTSPVDSLNDGSINANYPSIDAFCPMVGDATDLDRQQTNILKNRPLPPSEKDFDLSITLNKLLMGKIGDVQTMETKAASITGYVFAVKQEGPESTNCHSTDPSFQDTHIYLSPSANNTGLENCLVLEITPRMRQRMAEAGIDWTTQSLKSSLLGKMVTVKGWLLYDWEHLGQSKADHPEGEHNTRASVWEIHPITSINTQ